MQINDLPTYPEGRDLSLTDYHLIIPLLRDQHLEISDYNFTNIFAWRTAYEYKISKLNGMIITKGFFQKRPFFMPPIGNSRLAAETSYSVFELHDNPKDRPFLAVAPDYLAHEMDGMPHLKIISDRDDWDYIYKSSDLAELLGQKYHAKRNLINQFSNIYDVKVEDLTTATCAEAIEYSDRWCEQRDCDSDEGLEKEKCAIFQMLSHFEALRLHGILVRINGEIHAIALGEELNPETYVIHVEKGDQDMKGIYQFINQQLAMRVAPKYKWINREQDLGIAGLRRAKQSYHPDHFTEKYRVVYLKTKD